MSRIRQITAIHNTQKPGSQRLQCDQDNEVEALHDEYENGIDTNAAEEAITVSWQPGNDDITGLTRHIIRQRSKGFLASLVFALFGSLGASHTLHRIPALKTLPQIWCIAAWWVMLICIYNFWSWRLVRKSAALQSHLNAITIVGDHITLQYTDRESAVYKIQYMTSLSHWSLDIFVSAASA